MSQFSSYHHRPYKGESHWKQKKNYFYKHFHSSALFNSQIIQSPVDIIWMGNMWLSTILLCLSTLCISDAVAGRTFSQGYLVRGNLVELLENERISLSDEQWIDQNLDHFNPTDDRIWKQVQNIAINIKRKSLRRIIIAKLFFSEIFCQSR